WYYGGDNTLAVLIASRSDIDDLVPTLVAFQIEWNKLHRALQDVELSDESARRAAGATPDDWQRLRGAWGDGFDANLAAIKREECRIVLRLIGGSHLGFARNASRWWQPIATAMDELGARDAPIYFVSSNSHSLVNVLTGVARRIETEIIDWIGKPDRDLDSERRKLEAGHSRASRQNWLYYGARQVVDRDPQRARQSGDAERRRWRRDDPERGVQRTLRQHLLAEQLLHGERRAAQPRVWISSRQPARGHRPRHVPPESRLPRLLLPGPLHGGRD